VAAIYLTPLIGGLVLYSIIRVLVRAPGQSLQRRFQKIGRVQGLTEADIVQRVGSPNTRSAMPGGKYLLQWQATGYHVALRFGVNSVCEGVTHEHSA
jgi:hypothetical protein